MSLFDDALLWTTEDNEMDRAESLVRRAQRAADDLGLPCSFSTDETGVRIMATSWRRVPDRDADRFVTMLEDLAEAKRRGA